MVVTQGRRPAEPDHVFADGSGRSDRFRSSRQRTRSHYPAGRTRRRRRPRTAGRASEPRGRGRPKLGVVAREVTLSPWHWEWLDANPAAPRWRCEARGGGAAHQRRRGPRPAGEGCGLSFHVHHGRQPWEVRGGLAGACSPMTGGASSVWSPAGPTISATTSSSSPSATALRRTLSEPTRRRPSRRASRGNDFARPDERTSMFAKPALEHFPASSRP